MLGSTTLVLAVQVGPVAATFATAGMPLGRRIGSAWGRPVEVLGGPIPIAVGVRLIVEPTLA